MRAARGGASDNSFGGFVFDATGDGMAMTCSWPIMVKQTKSWSTTVRWWSRRESGPLVERTDSSYGGFVFDATGDGGDDVFVANDGKQTKSWSTTVRVAGAVVRRPLVERTDFSRRFRL